MSNTQHAPGPYSLGNIGPLDCGRFTREIVFTNGPHIGTSGPGYACGVTQAQADASAELFAAAPDMLTALTNARNVLRLAMPKAFPSMSGDDYDSREEVESVLADCDDAITRATGGH